VTIDREKVLQTAQGYIQKKRYDRAVLEYQKLTQQDPEDARILLKIGDLQSKMEAHADAISTYERVGRQYARQGFSLKAIAVYKQIREIIKKHVPNLADRYSHITPLLAELYTQLGLVSDALAAYDEVATQLQRAGQDHEAIDVFKKVVGLDATNPLPHLRLAEAYSRVRDNDNAIQHFATAAGILLELERYDDALKVLERLLHHRSDPVFARQAAQIYLARNQPNDGMLALAKLQVCFQADPRDLDTLGLLARAFVAIGQPAKAIEVEKEIARTARDQGRVDVYRQAVENLLQVAPDDEVVRKLAAAVNDVMRRSSIPASEAPVARRSSMPSEGPALLSDAEVEEIEESEPSAPIPSEMPTAQGHIIPEQQPEVRMALRPPAVSAPELEVAEIGAEADILVPPASTHPQKVLAEADSFYKLGLFDKAIARLDVGIDAYPDSVALRRRRRDVLYELGEYDRTADEMVQIAQVFIDQGAPEYAAEELQAVFSFVEDHPQAREMLAQLGYAIPGGDEIVPATDLGDDAIVPGDEPAERPPSARPEFDSVPLPSYDLEEVGADEAMSSPGFDVSADVYEPKRDALAHKTPLPAFPIDEEESPTGKGELPAAPLASAPPSETVEEALEEAEFFVSRGLLKDARDILDEQLRRLPNHPLLLERLREIDAAATQADASSGTRERPDGEAPAALPSAAAEPTDRAFDIAASLDALDAIDHAHAAFREPEQQVDVEEVFAKFKEGVRAQVSESDSQTHYDLGLAYREMGLVRDAIDEFEIAARDPKRECVSQSMIGMIHRAQDNVDGAIEAFKKGLHAESKTPDQESSLYYELGDCWESKGDASEALYFFRKVAHRSPSYNDERGSIAMRIRALQKPDRPPPGSAPPSNGSNDFDAAFDAVMTGGVRSGGKRN
jgi:tetratricopeptide (TPR) repeat protein